MKTSELSGAALDWAVAQCEYLPVRDGFDDNCPEYSTNWAQGGPIIERENISIEPGEEESWFAFTEVDTDIHFFYSGPTPLIAAMRCYVAMKLGDGVNIPAELTDE